MFCLVSLLAPRFRLTSPPLPRRLSFSPPLPPLRISPALTPRAGARPQVHPRPRGPLHPRSPPRCPSVPLRRRLLRRRRLRRRRRRRRPLPRQGPLPALMRTALSRMPCRDSSPPPRAWGGGALVADWEQPACGERPFEKHFYESSRCVRALEYLDSHRLGISKLAPPRSLAERGSEGVMLSMNENPSAPASGRNRRSHSRRSCSGETGLWNRRA